MPLAGIPRLVDLSADEREALAAQFQFRNERICHAPPASYMGREWSITLGAVDARVYKISALAEAGSVTERSHLESAVDRALRSELGRPSEPQPSVSVWDANDGNVVLYSMTLSGMHAVVLTLTSSAVRGFQPADEPISSESNTEPPPEITDLVRVIVKTSLDSSAEFAEQSSGGESLDERSMTLEFAYLFLHLVNRVAHSSLDELTHKRLTNALGPQVVDELLWTLYEPDSSTEEAALRDRIFNGVNQAEIEYAKCNGILEEPYFTGNSILSQFGRKLCDVIGSANPIDQVAAISASSKAVAGMNLDVLVTSAAGVVRSGSAASLPLQELPKNWRESLFSCNFLLAREELANVFQTDVDRAAARGEQVAYKEEFLQGWETFASNPRFRTAIEWIEAVPESGPTLYRYFMECSPGGRLFRR